MEVLQNKWFGEDANHGQENTTQNVGAGLAPAFPPCINKNLFTDFLDIMWQ